MFVLIFKSDFLYLGKKYNRLFHYSNIYVPFSLMTIVKPWKEAPTVRMSKLIWWHELPHVLYSFLVFDFIEAKFAHKNSVSSVDQDHIFTWNAVLISGLGQPNMDRSIWPHSKLKHRWPNSFQLASLIGPERHFIYLYFLPSIPWRIVWGIVWIHSDC